MLRQAHVFWKLIFQWVFFPYITRPSLLELISKKLFGRNMFFGTGYKIRLLMVKSAYKNLLTFGYFDSWEIVRHSFKAPKTKQLRNHVPFSLDWTCASSFSHSSFTSFMISSRGVPCGNLRATAWVFPFFGVAAENEITEGSTKKHQ